MISPELKAKITWRCRRGMLELDLILNRFIQQHLDNLSDTQLQTFQLLLEQPDPDLYAFFMSYEQSQDETLHAFIQYICQHDLSR